MDWPRWIASEHATLLFVVRGDRVLLIHKKTGLGAGKINGPGGRLEPGETPRQAAIREVEEELHITPRGVRAVGELRFQFHDGFAIHGYVFRAGAYTGTPTETAEACPIWTPLARIPYSRMWADDRLWMPLMLARQSFSGHFLFEGDRLREHRIETPARLAFDLH